MPTTSPAQFFGLLKQNSLLSDKHLDRVARKLESFESTKDLANYLAQNDLLTGWQANQLLAGKNAPQVGQYWLTDLLAKDEFGKRFAGVHKKNGQAVEVQVLSKKISDEVFEKSKSLIAQLTSLVHPNLAHCLKIDRVKGCFVIVAERLPGGTLAGTNPSEFCESDVASMVRQCLTGLTLAHERNVYHGELKRSSVVICSDEFKIRDFAIANIKRVSSEEEDEEQDSEDDLFMLSEIGLEMLGEMPPSTSELRKSLLKIISDLGVAELDGVSALLDGWIAENETPQPDRRTESLAAEPKFSDIKDSQTESSAAKQESGKKSKTQPAKKSKPNLGKRQRTSPLLMFGGIAAVFAIIFGSLFALWNSTRPLENQVANADTIDALDGPVPFDEAAEIKDDLETDRQADLKSVNLDQTPAVDSNPQKANAPNQKTAVAPVKSPQESKKEKAQTASKSPAKPTKPKGKSAEPAAKDKPTVAKLTFREFAKHLELPALDNVEPVEIGKLTLNPAFLLGAKLFISPEASRKAGIFELQRSSDDKQRWLVSKRKSKNSDPVDVATFWKTEGALHFQWLPAAQLDENVNYLRNGSLKLETPDGQYGWLSLRSPLTIEGFQLAAETGSTEVKLNIPWLPSPKGLVIEIGTFADRDIPGFCTNEFVQPRAPALMYFTTDESEAFLWLEISASQRSAIVLKAELKINELGAIKTLVPAAISQYRQANEAIAANAGAAIKATQDKNKKEQFASVQKSATKTAGAFGKYQTIVPKISGRDIPVAIYLNVDKKHQLLIAKSPGFIDF